MTATKDQLNRLHTKIFNLFLLNNENSIKGLSSYVFGNNFCNLLETFLLNESYISYS